MKKFLPLLLVSAWLPFVTEAQDGNQLLRERKYREIIDSHRTSDVTRVSDETLYLLAQAHEGCFEFRTAASYYRMCFERDTTRTDHLFKIAEILQRNGSASEALGYYRLILEKDPDNTYAATQTALLHLQTGELETAARQLEVLIEKDPTNAYLWYNLGNCYNRMRLTLESISAYSLAYQKDKANEGYAIALISMLFRYSLAAADAPTDDDTSPVLQNMLFQPEEEVLQICDTTLSYLPGNRRLLRNKGIALYRLRRTRQADTIFSRLLEEGDSSQVTLKYAGVVKYKLQDYIRAREYFRLHNQLDSTDNVVNLSYASTLSYVGDPQGSLRMLARVERDIQPDENMLFNLYYFRAVTYQRSQNRPEALKNYYAAYQLLPERGDIFNAIFRMYSNYKDQPDEAKEVALFAAVKYVEWYLAAGRNPRSLTYFRDVFRYFQEDTFFKGQVYAPMRSPDNIRSRISLRELSDLIVRIPERDTGSTY